MEDLFLPPSSKEHSELMVSENTRVGALFASKAFVQLLINPLVGKATGIFGYELPFLIGTVFLFISSISKHIDMIDTKVKSAESTKLLKESLFDQNR